jgi:origin recognition complex subunit 1
MITSQPPAHAEIKSAEAWSVSPSKSSKTRLDYRDDDDDDEDEKYFCHLAVNSQRGLFYDFKWEEHLENALAASPSSEEDWGSGAAWKVEVDESNPSPAKKRPGRSAKTQVESESENGGTEDEYEGTDDDDDDLEDELTEDLTEDDYGDPRTPSKKRKRTSSPTKTPRKPRKTTAHPTPHSKAALRRCQQPASPRKSPMKIRPPPPAPLAERTLQLEQLPKDPWLRAMHMLHVGSKPDELPCREEEYAKVLRSVEELIDEGSGGCVCKFIV